AGKGDGTACGSARSPPDRLTAVVTEELTPGPRNDAARAFWADFTRRFHHSVEIRQPRPFSGPNPTPRVDWELKLTFAAGAIGPTPMDEGLPTFGPGTAPAVATAALLPPRVGPASLARGGPRGRPGPARARRSVDGRRH